MRRLGLVSRFAVLSAVLIAVLGFVLARSIGTAITEPQPRERRGRPRCSCRGWACNRGSTPGRSWRTGCRRLEIDELDRSLRAGFSDHDIARIKIWNSDTIASSTPTITSIIGQALPERRRARRRARRRSTTSEVSNLKGAENAQDRSTDNKLLEVYTPIQFTAGEPARGRVRDLPAVRTDRGRDPPRRRCTSGCCSSPASRCCGPRCSQIVLERVAPVCRRRCDRNEYQASHDPLTDLAQPLALRRRRRRSRCRDAEPHARLTSPCC